MKLLGRLKIRTFLALFILICILVPSSAATLFSYTFTRRTIQKQYTDNYIQSMFSEIDSSISMVVSKMNAFTLHLLNYKEIPRIVEDSNLSYQQKYEKLQTIFSALMNDDTMTDAIDFVTTDGSCYRFGERGIGFPEPREDFLNSLSGTRFVFSGECIQDSGRIYCVIGKRVHSYNNGYELGNIIFYINEEILGALYAVSESNESTFFISSDKKIISHPDKSYIGSRMYLPPELVKNMNQFSNTSRDYVFTEHLIDNPSIANAMQITCIVSNRSLFLTMNTIIQYILLSFVITALLAAVASVLLSKKLILRLSNLKHNMEHFTVDYQNLTPITPSNEIAVLEHSFDKMASEIKTLISAIEVEKEKQRIAEITALQSQINPHFIYNALDSISWKAKENRQYEIDDMLVTLATFFRIGLHRGDALITISDELTHVKSYLEIEAIRFPNLFDVSYDIDETILNCMTIKIILQPIVENSIKHGFKELDRKGHIRIRISAAGQDILMEVTDNGRGMELTSGQLPRSASTSGGYGLYNVNQRLLMYYGRDYGLQIKSALHQGTQALIRIKKTDQKNEGG